MVATSGPGQWHRLGLPRPARDANNSDGDEPVNPPPIVDSTTEQGTPTTPTPTLSRTYQHQSRRAARHQPTDETTATAPGNPPVAMEVKTVGIMQSPEIETHQNAQPDRLPSQPSQTHSEQALHFNKPSEKARFDSIAPLPINPGKLIHHDTLEILGIRAEINELINSIG